MKLRHIIIACAALFCCFGGNLQAQTDKAPAKGGDAILGEYFIKDEKAEDSKVRFTKNADGTYACTIFWIETENDPATGKPWTDSKNPDKSLRNRPLIGVKLIESIPYDAKKNAWTGGKIYDPNRGLKANATISITEDGRLKVSGKILGIGETQYWDRL